MPDADFDAYFDARAARFSRFYGSEGVARLLGRGALFDRLRGAVNIVVALNARSVLDVGCGSGPLFEPLASRGVHVLAVDPAPGMVQLARAEARRFPGKVQVQQRKWEEIDEGTAVDAAVALGVFDYVDQREALLERLLRAAPDVIASFPAPGLRLRFRQLRYGIRGVEVHGYRLSDLRRMAEVSGSTLEKVTPLGRAGHLAHFARLSPQQSEQRAAPRTTTNSPPQHRY